MFIEPCFQAPKAVERLSRGGEHSRLLLSPHTSMAMSLSQCYHTVALEFCGRFGFCLVPVQYATTNERRGRLCSSQTALIITLHRSTVV